MNATRKLWTGLAVVFFVSFAILGWLGREIYLAAPPYPTVKTEAGEVLFTETQVRDGQRAWLAAGGQQLGSVWGHGSYVAPDWSADWLHREAVAYREVLSRKMHRKDYAQLDTGERGAVDLLVKQEMRRNTHDPDTNTVTVSAERAAAIAEVQAHYTALFGDDARQDVLREQYAAWQKAPLSFSSKGDILYLSIVLFLLAVLLKRLGVGKSDVLEWFQRGQASTRSRAGHLLRRLEHRVANPPRRRSWDEQRALELAYQLTLIRFGRVESWPEPLKTFRAVRRIL